MITASFSSVLSNVSSSLRRAHCNLRPEVREAAENLWDDLLDGLRQFQEPPSEPDPTR